MTEVTLFSYITKEEQERMRVCFRMREASFQNNETIMEYSSSMKKIGLILDGQASVYCYDEEGRQYLLDELKKDGVFGEPFLLPEESQHYYVCAKSKTRVLFIDYEHVIKRCENACSFHSQLVSNLLQMIAMHASRQANRIFVLSRGSTKKKIMAYLHFTAEECKSNCFTLPMSYTSMAEYLSVDRSAMMRELKMLSDEGLIEKDGKKLRIPVLKES